MQNFRKPLKTPQGKSLKQLAGRVEILDNNFSYKDKVVKEQLECLKQVSLYHNDTAFAYTLQALGSYEVVK